MLKRIILKKILTILIFPTSVFSLLGVWFSFLLLKNKVTAKAKYIFIGSFFLFVIITMQPTAAIMVHSLENDYASLVDTNKIKEAEFIIVLGGGYNDGNEMPASSLLSNGSLSRLIEGIRLKQINKSAKLIFSGGKPYTENHTEASIYQNAYKSLTNDNIPQILSELPHNTKSEADEAFKLVGNKKMILVTSSTHMPRAMYLFQKMGCNVTPAPCEFFVKTLKYYPNFPSGNSIKQTEIAIHEYIGLLGYKLFD
ncbi:MAG: YdcF family protein [Candidatus Methylacidiphilales bacterium]